MDSLELNACPTNGLCPMLLYNSATGRYNYDSGASSDLIRTINAEDIDENNGDEVKITSTVYIMKGSSIAYKVSFSENLFNWIQ